MANTKDDIIKFQDETLDNIEAILNLGAGSKLIDDEGNTFLIAFDTKNAEYCLIANESALISKSDNINNYIVAFLHDNFVGNKTWTIVE